MKLRTRSYERKKARYGYFFIGIWLIGFVFVFLIPLFTSLVYSFNIVKVRSGMVDLKPVGLENYVYALMEDANFPTALVETLTAVVTQTPLIVLFSLFIAVVLNNPFKGRTLVRTIFFLPVIIASSVVINIISGDRVMNMLSSGQRASMMFEAFSMQDYLLSLSIDTRIITFVTDIVNNIFNLTWKSGIQILILLAALQSVSADLYEAAKVEGATAWETFWKITFPMVTPMIMVNTIYTIIDNYINYSTPVFKVIQDYSQRIEFDYASAMSWINFIIIFIIVAAVSLIFNRRAYYANE